MTRKVMRIADVGNRYKFFSRKSDWFGIIFIAVFIVNGPETYGQPQLINPGRPGLDVLGQNPPDAGLNQGTVTYRVELDLPPAPAGHVPSVALVANHQISDGPVGVGWMLEGLSRIERRGPHGGSPRFEADDTFWLDGTKLVKVASDWNAYRLKYDDGRIFRISTETGTYSVEHGGYIFRGRSWEVKRAGWTWIYGASGEDSGLISNIVVEDYDEYSYQPCSSPYKVENPTGWLLSRVIDPHGNEIKYEYEVNCSSVYVPTRGTAFWGNYALERQLSKISYAGGSVEINFEYGNEPEQIGDPIEYRKDSRFAARGGRIRILRYRLEAIQVVVDALGARVNDARYELTYFDEATETCDGNPISDTLDDLSILQRITRVGTDGSARLIRCMSVNTDDTNFEYVGDIDLTPPEGMDCLLHRMKSLAVNFDGNPYPDLLVMSFSPQDCVYDNTEPHLVYANTQSGWSDDPPTGLAYDEKMSNMVNEAIPSWIDDPEAARYGHWMIADIDRDLADEIVVLRKNIGTNTIQHTVYEYDSTSKIGYTTHDDWIDFDHDGINLSEIEFGSVVDIDGDGFVDLIVTKGANSLNTQWIRNSGSPPYWSLDNLEEMDLPFENSESSTYITLSEAWDECNKELNPVDPNVPHEDYTYPPSTIHSIPFKGQYLPTGLAYETRDDFIADQARWSDVNGDGVTDVAYSFHTCWTEDGPWNPSIAGCEHASPSSLCNGIFSEVFYGDGRGNFNPGYTLVSTPFLTDRRGPNGSDIPIPDGWDVDDVEHYMDIVYGAGFWQAWDTWSMADVDGTAYSQMVHGHYPTISGENATLRVTHDYGLESGFKIGDDYTYGDGTGEDCVTGQLNDELELPGYALADVYPHPHNQVIADWDADGFADVLRIFDRARVETSIGGIKNADFRVEVHLNQRTVARGRLERIQLPRGGEVQFTYGPSTESGKGFHNSLNCEGAGNTSLPFVMEVIDSVTDERGKREFAFSKGVLDTNEGRFAGFGQAVVRHETGRITDLRYSTKQLSSTGEFPMLGKIESRAEYRAQGPVEFFSVYSYLDGLVIKELGWPITDYSEPFYNPLAKQCDFWIPVPAKGGMPIDLRGLVSQCCGFDRNSQGIDDNNPEDPVGNCATYEPCSCYSSTPIDNQFPFLATAQPPELTIVPDDPGRPDLHGDVTDHQMYVQEWTYDASDQLMLEYLNARDANVVEDDILTTYDWEDHWNEEAEGKQLETIEQTDFGGNLLKLMTRSDFGDFDQARMVSESGLSDCSGELVTRSWQYAYDETGEVASITDPENNLTQVVTRNTCGQVTQQNDAVLRTELNNYDTACRKIDSNFEGGTLTITRDGFGRIETKETTFGDAYTEETPEVVETWYRDDSPQSDLLNLDNPVEGVLYGDGNINLYYEDKWGRSVLTVTCSNAGPGGSPETNVLSNISCVPGTEIYEYTGWATDGSLRVESRPFSTSQTGVAATWTFVDEFGRDSVILAPGHVAVEDATKDTFARTTYLYEPGKTTETNPSDIICQIEFSTLSEEKSCADILVNSLVRDSVSNVVQTVDGDGVTSISIYDEFDRLCEQALSSEITVYEEGNETTKTPSWHYIWDHADRLVSVEDPIGNITTFSYDDVNRPLTRCFEDQSTSTLTEIASWNYYPYVKGEEKSRHIELTDKNGHIFTRYLDGAGRTIEIERPDLKVRTTRWDERSRVESITEVDGESLSFAYDVQGLPTNVTGPNPLWSRVFEYNAARDLVSETDRDGVTTIHTPLWSGKASLVTRGDWTLGSWTYRDDGLVELANEGGVVTSYTYDSLGRTESAYVGYDTSDESCALEIGWKWTDGNRLEESRRRACSDTVTFATQYSYNDAGWRSSVIHPDTNTEQLIYDALGRLRRYTDEEGIVAEVDFDGLNRITAQRLPGQGERRVSYEFGLEDTNLGLVERHTWTEPDGGVWVALLDFAERPVFIDTPELPPTIHMYTGNRLTEIQTIQQAPVILSTYDGKSRTFESTNKNLWRSARGHNIDTELNPLEPSDSAKSIQRKLARHPSAKHQGGVVAVMSEHDISNTATDGFMPTPLTTTTGDIITRTLIEYDPAGRPRRVWGPVNEARYQEVSGEPVAGEDYYFEYAWLPSGRVQAITGPNTANTFSWVNGFLEHQTMNGVTSLFYEYETESPRLANVRTGTTVPFRNRQLTWERGLWLNRETLTDDTTTAVNMFSQWDAFGTPTHVTSLINGIPQVEYVYDTDLRGRINKIETSVLGSDFLIDERGYYKNGYIHTIDLAWQGALTDTDTIEYVRDSANDFNLEEVRDGVGNAIATIDKRDRQGRATSVSLADGGLVQYIYDKQNRIERQTVTSGLSGEIMVRDYDFDHRGRLRSTTISKIPAGDKGIAHSGIPACDDGGTCDIGITLTGLGFNQTCPASTTGWVSLAFPIETNGQNVCSVKINLGSNAFGGDLYLLGDTNGNPDTSNILYASCNQIEAGDTGEKNYVIIPAVETGDITWIVAVLRKDYAFTIMQNSNAPDNSGTNENLAFANTSGSGAAGSWVDLADTGFGQCFCVSVTTCTDSPRVDEFTYREPGWLEMETRFAGDPKLEEVRTYSYDAAGNRTTRTIENIAKGTSDENLYTYSLGNLLETVDSLSVSWDDFGSMTQDHRGFKINRGPLGTATSVATPNSQLLFRFVRDAFRNPVSMITPNGTRTQVWGNPGTMQWPMAGKNELGNSVYWVAAEGLLLARIDNGVVRSTAIDPKGSLLMINGVFKSETGAWGDDTNPALPGSERFLYAGLEKVPGPFMSARQRLYDPDLGRFLSADPLLEIDGANLFMYAANNPLQYVDPSGMYYEDPLNPSPNNPNGPPITLGKGKSDKKQGKNKNKKKEKKHKKDKKSKQNDDETELDPKTITAQAILEEAKKAAEGLDKEKRSQLYSGVSKLLSALYESSADSEDEGNSPDPDTVGPEEETVNGHPNRNDPEVALGGFSGANVPGSAPPEDDSSPIPSEQTVPPTIREPNPQKSNQGSTGNKNGNKTGNSTYENDKPAQDRAVQDSFGLNSPKFPDNSSVTSRKPLVEILPKAEAFLKGPHIKVKCDTTGKCEVEGSTDTLTKLGPVDVSVATNGDNVKIKLKGKVGIFAGGMTVGLNLKTGIVTVSPGVGVETPLAGPFEAGTEVKVEFSIDPFRVWEDYKHGDIGKDFYTHPYP